MKLENNNIPRKSSNSASGINKDKSTGGVGSGVDWEGPAGVCSSVDWERPAGVHSGVDWEGLAGVGSGVEKGSSKMDVGRSSGIEEAD